MQTIQLPISRCIRFAGWGLITACSMLVLATHTAWPWRLGLAILVLAVGGLLRRRYLRRRPVALHAGARDSLTVTPADGREVAVEQVTIGVVRPWLVSARLYVADGRRLDLFVPGRSLSSAQHWRLRRALTVFRPAGEGARPPQSAERRGT